MGAFIEYQYKNDNADSEFVLRVRNFCTSLRLRFTEALSNVSRGKSPVHCCTGPALFGCFDSYNKFTC